MKFSRRSTTSYKYLARKLNLPPKRTVSRWVQKVSFKEGFDEDLFCLLKERVAKMPDEHDKVVNLLCDEMSLKEALQYDKGNDKVVGVCKTGSKVEFTSSALVFMVSGMKRKWRQAILYHFAKNAVSSTKLQPMITSCITKLQECGLHVVNVTTDQGSNFSSLMSTLGVTPTHPYFCLGDQKIHYTPGKKKEVKKVILITLIFHRSSPPCEVKQECSL